MAGLVAAIHAFRVRSPRECAAARAARASTPHAETAWMARDKPTAMTKLRKVEERVTTEADKAPPAIELIGIDKSFGPVHANNNVNLVVERGVIHGIVGENGAGKSTLMSILYGFYEADAGEIRVNGEPVSIRSSREAISHGIGMVHQHFMLVPPLSVLENVMLGAEGGPLLAEGRGRDPQAARRARAGIRPRGRSRRDRRRIVGRPAAAGRDPEGAGARRRNPGARRADGGADAGRGRPAVRDAAGCSRARTRRSSSSPTSCARS